MITLSINEFKDQSDYKGEFYTTRHNGSDWTIRSARKGKYQVIKFPKNGAGNARKMGSQYTLKSAVEFIGKS